MSRSYRKNPAGGITCARTDKPFKRFANRAFRRASNVVTTFLVEFGNLYTELDDDLVDPPPDYPILKELSDPWGWPKDGKTWYPKRDYVPDYRIMSK
jgi:hypothetical protein